MLRLRVLLLVLAAMALLGCAREPMQLVPRWTLLVGTAPPRDLSLPRYFPIEGDAASYALTTEVPLDPALRGADLTLVLTAVDTLARLRVDDETIAPLDLTPFDRVRPTWERLVFRIPARLTDRDRLPLRLEVTRRSFIADGLGATPFLVRGEYGDTVSRAVLGFDRVTLFGAIVVFSILGIAMTVLYLLDRRRAADGWFALIAGGLLAWHVAGAGITQSLVPLDVVRIPIASTFVIIVATIGFIYAHFDLGRAPRLVLGAFSAIGLLDLLLVGGPFDAKRGVWADNLLEITVLVVIVYEVWLLVRIARRGGPKRTDAIALAAVWGLLFASEIAQSLQLPINLRPIVWIVFVLLQAVMLVRAHARTLRGLNAELAARVALLEQKSRDVAALNDELRRQVGDRSARLFEALSRLGPLGRSDAELAEGELVASRYRVIRTLGAGAMGTVYEVERTSDGQRLALKLLKHAHGAASLARFAREAQIAAKVAHPNLVGIFDLDVTQGGLPFMVLELVHGEALTERARIGDEDWVTAVLAQVAAGLAALHEAGIVHRDLKPSNVLVDEQSAGGVRAKIVDFGVSRLADTVDAAADTIVGSTDSRNPALTQTGILVGTPLYMAPELARGAKDAAPSSDMWSFGVVAFELFMGRLPFAVPPVQELVTRGTWRAPQVDAGALPPGVGDLVARCLDADPARRPSAREAAEALARKSSLLRSRAAQPNVTATSAS